MGELGQFLSSNSGVPQRLDDHPGPEGVILHKALVDPARGAVDLLDEDLP
ncbi:hypothetical protein [Streptomyces mirabilis]